MRYADFRAQTEKLPLFNSKLYKNFTDDPATLRRQISQWLGQGYVIPLKRGVYTLCDKDRRAQFSRYFLANQLYWPVFH